MERNIAALVARRQQLESRRTLSERAADGIGGFAGSLFSVYVHAAAFGAWIAINLRLTPFQPFDPSLVMLAMIASVEAIFLSTFVLIMQNRLAALGEKRAELDLQISLLAEHEITRVLQLVSAMAKKMDVPGAENPEFEQLKSDVAPEQVLDRMEALDLQRKPSGPKSGP